MGRLRKASRYEEELLLLEELEMEGRRAPQEQTEPLAVLLRDLIEAVAGGKAGPRKCRASSSRSKC